MVQNEDPILRITLGPADTLADLLPRIREHRGRPVFLTVPASAPLFLTASEFRALRETVRSHGVNLTLISDDPQRRDFADLFHLASASEEPEGWPTGEAAPGLPSPEIADPALGPPRPRRPLGSTVSGAWGSSWPGAGEAAKSWPQRTGEPLPDTTFPLVVVQPEPEPEPAKKRRKWPWVTALILLLVAALAGAGIVVPKATVTIAGARTPITTSVVFGVVAPGAFNPSFNGAAFTVQGSRTQTTVTVSATVPATGKSPVPGDPAKGAIAFANPTNAPVTIPAGTQIVGDQEIAFTLDADISVPAVANGASGTASGAITAVVGGSAGNLAQGALSGKLDSGVYFNNRDAALAGGTDLEAPVVTDADIAAATEQLEALLPEQAAQALTNASGKPVGVVPNSVRPSALNPTSDVPAGTQAGQVTVSATTSATLLTYDPEAARTQIIERAVELANAAAPGSYDRDSIQIGTPVPSTGDATGGQVEVPVTIDRLIDLDQAAIDKLRDDIVTKSTGEAGKTISGVEGVESYSIEIEPDWWPGDRLPVLADRIKVVVK